MSMKLDIYIYYRVAAEHVTPFCAAASAMQATLSAEHKIVSLLKRRPEESAGAAADPSAKFHTWMEIYLAVPEDFEQVIAQHLKQAGIATWIEGVRHVETFFTVAKSGVMVGEHACA
ncbi:DUF4936 family protein [Glaciimonas soli]|uniref:DUF4936 family protein n=1 Tax=Glaciimonas soli TaxID=2590999 RepID=A0A843YMG0_9BURK|nr:DUF4936 family protein [Glaciimonas soli]MQQ99156.1 DUF4936 family protein [Glaciimonas soli]